MYWKWIESTIRSPGEAKTSKKGTHEGKEEEEEVFLLFLFFEVEVSLQATAASARSAATTDRRWKATVAGSPSSGSLCKVRALGATTRARQASALSK